MKVRCEYCNGYVDDSEKVCPTCGAPNKDYKRVGEEVPTTIKELEEWYKVHNLPPYEVTRFFIGIDYKDPKAFGIYKDDNTGKFVVYKNKDTGERKIRYEGKDEKYAVNELYMKLKEEIVNQKSLNIGRNNATTHASGSKFGVFAIFFVIGLGILVNFIIPMVLATPNRGYYSINDQEYYYVSGGWYVYGDDGWTSTTKPNYEGDISSYYDGYSYDSTSPYTDITTSDVYDESWESSSRSSSSSDWDSSSSWDSSDSWDSGGTDWSSDW